jgi:hypothetical protein
VRKRIKSECPAVAQVVKQAMSEQRISYRNFAEKAVDPETGYRLSHGLVNDIARGFDFRVSPPVLRALAAGTGFPLAIVQEAAIRQFIRPAS